MQVFACLSQERKMQTLVLQNLFCFLILLSNSYLKVRENMKAYV